MSPAAYVIRVFGGVRATARAIGRTPGAVSKWATTKHGGCGGKIPSAAQRRILIVAKRKRLDITPTDLIFGRTVKGRPSKEIRR